jgi:hypothetical protein
VILSYGAMLQGRFEPGTPESEAFDEIQKAAKRGSELTSQLLVLTSSIVNKNTSTKFKLPPGVE